MSRAPVFTSDPAYSSAVGQLASAAVPANDPDGAVCVIAGSGSWWHEAERMHALGARGVVVDRPGRIPAARLEELVERGALTLPVRPRLRPEGMPSRPTTARLLSVQALAPRDQAHVVTRDAVGWLRLLVGEALEFGSVARSGSTVLASATSAETPVSLCVVSGMSDALTSIELVAVGEERLHMRVGSNVAGRQVVHVGEHGALTAPLTRESVERSALRRALYDEPEAIRRELQEMLADVRTAERLCTQAA